MNRLCERPGCSAPADVAYGFDADHLIVWLDAIVEVQGQRYGVLCRRHADAMIVPLGWMLDDRREPTLRLFKAPAIAVPARPRRERERRARREDEQLTLEPPPSPEPEPVELAPEPPVELALEPEPTRVELEPTPQDAEPVPAWVPVFDEEDDLHGLLKPRGRLLSRAFNGTPLADD